MLRQWTNPEGYPRKKKGVRAGCVARFVQIQNIPTCTAVVCACCWSLLDMVGEGKLSELVILARKACKKRVSKGQKGMEV